MKRLWSLFFSLFFGLSVVAEEGIELSSRGLPKVWLQGEKITDWETNKLYLIECWATWCAPCIAAIPHLEKLHLHYKDDLSVQIVGINVYDNKAPDVIEKFLKGLRVPPSYTIAIDTDKSVAEQWLKPLNVTGIPFSCAVRNGKTIWRGHPSALSIDAIAQMKKLDFTPADLEKEQPRSASSEATDNLNGKLWTAVRENNHEKVDQMLSKLMAEETETIDTKRNAFVSAALYSFKQDQSQKGNHYLARTVEQFNDDPYALMRVVHILLSYEEIPVENRDLSIAEKALQRCIECSEKDPRKLMVYYDKLADIALLHGDFNTAFDYETKAIQHSGSYRNRLTYYEKLVLPTPELACLVKPENIVANPIIPMKATVLDPTTPKAEGPDATRANELLEQVEWLRGSFPFLPADKPVFIEMWRLQQRGERPFMAYNSVPGHVLKTKLSKAGIAPNDYYIIAIPLQTGGRDNLATIMNYSYNSNEVPVADPGELQSACNALFLPEKYDDYPLTAVFVDGTLLWKGPIKRMPDLVMKHLFSNNHDHVGFLKQLEKHQTEATEGFEIYRAIIAAQKTADTTKLEELEKKLLVFAKEHEFLGMYATELEIGRHYETRAFDEIIATFNRCLDDFPESAMVANRIFKYATADIELKEHAHDLILRCCDIMLRNNLRMDPDYDAAWHNVAADIEASRANYKAAILASEAAIDASWYGQRLQAIRNGIVPWQR